MVNLGDTTHTEYRQIPSHTVSHSRGIYNAIVKQHEYVITAFYCIFNTSLIEPVNPIALRKAKIIYNFGLSECSGVK